MSNFWHDLKYLWPIFILALIPTAMIAAAVIFSEPGTAVEYGPEDLVYFRDDNHQQCYTMFKGHPESLTAISCTKGYW